MYFKRKTLPNGLRIVFEKLSHVQSVSIGLWIAAGTRYEDINNNGISHFIEHMMFKGTTRRKAKDIAEEVDNIGGQLNAFTGKECTCYYAKVLNSHIDLAFDILSDMMFHSLFDQTDIEKEKNVVLEEINMYEDNPEELIHDLFAANILKGHPLGLPVLGTRSTTGQFSRSDIVDYLRKFYRPDNTVISVVGNTDFDDIVRYTEEYFGHWGPTESPINKSVRPSLNYKSEVKKKDTEQVHFCLGFNGLDQKDENLYSFLALNNLLGGGMSSRLFQKIREDLGLVYSVYCYPATYNDIGIMTIYAGTSRLQLNNVLECIIDEVKSIRDNGVTDSELSRVKEQMKGNYILGMEGTGSRMSSLGKSALLLGEVYTQQQIIDKIDRIDKKSFSDVAGRVIDFDRMAFTVLGNIEPSEIVGLGVVE
jgi:predicted Zn-dependent peptidase